MEALFIEACIHDRSMMHLGHAAGELAVTYLDEELRISRGDKGNLFVLVMEDPEDRP